VPLKKPSQLFNSEVVEEELSSPVKKYLNETYQQFQGTLSNIENLQEKIDQIYTEYPKTFELLAEEVSNRVTKSDLDNVMYSQLEVVDRSFKEIQEKVKGVNRKDLRDFKDNVSQLTEIVNNLIETELPQYKNRVTKTEVKLSDKFQSTENKVTDEINKFSTFLEEKIGEFDNDLEQTKEDVLNTNETFNKLRTIVKDEHLENNQKLEKFSETLNEFNSEANNFRDSLSDSLENDIDDFKKELKSLVSTDFIILEKHVKDDNEKLEEKINTYIEDNQKELVKLKDNVIDDVSDIFKGDIAENVKKLENKIKNIQEQYDNIKPEEIIQEGLLNIQSNEKNSDPLTPLDQNFVTTKQLQDHYRIFLNRVQEQLSTLGGGGETRLEFLDDVDRDTALINGKVLQYDSATKKWKGASAAGIGTEDSLVTSGIITAGNVTIGGITTALVVNGDAAITGILTVGESTLTLDGDNNIVQVGTALTLGHTNGIQFHTQNLHASGFEVNQINASGITTVNQLNVSGDGYESSIITESNYFSIKDSTNTSALFTPTGSAQLNYNNQTKIQTTNTGASITGKIEATDAEFTGNVSIAGTLTYEDVTNIDSVGLITARNGINIPTNKTIGLGDTISATIEYNSYGVMNRLNKHGASDFTWKLEDEDGTMHMEVRSGTTNSYVKLKQNNNTKFETKDYGVEITGTTDTDQLNVSGITTFGGNATFSADGTFTTSSGFTIENAQPGISFVDTGANPDFIIQNRDGSFAIRDTTSNANRFLVNMANGDVTVTGGLDVDGHTELDNVNVSGISTFVGDMNVANGSGIIEDAGGQLKIRANTFNFRDIGNTRQMLFVSQLGGAKLYHNGNQKFETLGFGATVYGTTQTQQLNVSGVSTFSKAVGISSNLNVTDNLNVAGITNLDNVSITGVSTFTGNIDLNADLDVDGHTELDDVNVSGVTSITAGAFASNVTAGGRTVATNIDIQSVSARTGIVVRNVYNYRTDSSPFGGFQVWDPYDSAATSYAFIAAAGATLVDKAWIKTDGTAYFAENVGIGITNPDAYQSSSRNLVIGKASDAAGITIRTGTSNGGYIRFADGTSGNQAYRGTIAYVHDGDYMMFATDSTEKVRITSGGDVGIGTTNPQAKLDVNGYVNVAGIVTSNMIHLTGGTYRAGIDAITDSAIIVNEDFAIYCLETGGDYLRAIIEKDSNIISIGQPNTTTIQAIDLKPGFSGAVRLHHGTSGTNNVKLQTTGYGVSVTGLEVTGISTVQDLDVTGNNIFLDHGGSMSGVTTIGSYYYDKLVINSAVNSSVYADNPNWPAPAPHDMGWTGFEWRDGFFQGSVMSGELSRFDLTSAGIGSTHVNLTVQVATKSTDHRYHGQGSTSGYVIFEAGGSKSAIHSPFFTFTPGRKYRFDQSHNSNSTHQIKFYLEADRTTLYETGVTYNGTAGNAGAYTQIEITDTTPNVLHYQCVNHSYMGNSFQTNSNTSSKKFDSDITLSDDVKAIFGSTGAGDLQIFHGSTGNYINANVVRTTNTNTLLFEVANGSNGISFNHRTGNGNNDFENMITATPNAGVDLYFNGNKKIETTDSGSILTGLTTVTPSVEFTSSSYPSREFSLVFVDPSTNTQYAANVGVAKTLYHRYGGISFDDYSNTLSASGIEYFKTRNILVTTNNNNNRMHLRQGYGGSNSGGDASLGDTDNSSIALFESNGSAYITVASGIHTNIDAGVLFATSNGPTRGAILYNDQFQTLKFNTLSRSASNTRLSLSESGAVVSGVVTATSFKGPSGVTATFIGDGSGLTGITASGSGIVIKNSGSVVGTAGTIDFGANLSVSAVSSGIVTVTGSASGGGVTVQDEGSSLSTTATTLNFVGDGVVASGTGATKTITIPGGGSSAGGGLFSIEGERSGGVNLNNYYAVGNGAQPTQGQRIPVATSLKYMTLSNDGNSTMTVELYVNGSGSGKTISLSSSSAATADFTSSPLSIAAGDRVTFRCVAGSSTHTSVVAGWFHQNAVLPDSLVGTALSVSGISTIGNVLVGGGTTDLVVNGDARVTGILTVGTGSITIDPNEDKIQVGKVVLPNGNATTDTNAIAFAIALG